MRAAVRLAALVLLAAPAVPMPAASLSRTYGCFFDPGSAELSSLCQAIVLEFSEWWHRTRRGEHRTWPEGTTVPAKAMQVEVEGHADAAEAMAGKASVGRARAKAVAAFLRLNGVPADVIKIEAFGADRPLVPSAGAEPQNRRAWLVAK